MRGGGGKASERGTIHDRKKDMGSPVGGSRTEAGKATLGEGWLAAMY